MKKFKVKRIICYLTILCGILWLVNCNPVYAENTENTENTEELAKRRAELKEKISEAGQDLENIDVQLTENLETISKLEEEIEEYEKKIQIINKNIEQIEKQTFSMENALETLDERYEYQKTVLQKRLVAAYECGKVTYLDVLLNSKDMVDFISRYHVISRIVEYDKNLLDNIEKQKNEIEKIRQNLDVTKGNLKVVKTEQRKMTVALENAKVIKQSYANKLTAEELEIKNQLSIYQDELDLINLEILITALEGSDSKYVGGVFAWPTPGYYTITSKYGMRIHPILKTYSKHSGMDIGAPLGAFTIAANDGIVTKATYSYSYGNMVMIDHGGGISTVYAHGSEILVDVGDTVQRGDPIMKVGSTGWSTGSHLHFEIRIKGQTIDPYPYVTIE